MFLTSMYVETHDQTAKNGVHDFLPSCYNDFLTVILSTAFKI